MSTIEEVQDQQSGQTVEEIKKAPTARLFRARLRGEDYTIPGTTVVWKLNALTSEESAFAKAEAVNSAGLVTMAAMYRFMVKLGCVGFSGAQDDEGQPIAFQSERFVSPSGVARDVMSEEVLNLMPDFVVTILGQRIGKLSELQPAEKKSSVSTTVLGASGGTVPGGESAGSATE